MQRREFLGLAALVVLAEACDAGSITGPALGSDVLVTLSDYPGLSATGVAVRLSGVSPPVALVREGPDTFAAFSLRCPHQGTTVEVTGAGFVCPNHGARFAADGRWVGGQKTSGLHEYSTVFDPAAGTVLILAG